MGDAQQAPQAPKYYKSRRLGLDVTYRDEKGKRIPVFFVNGEFATADAFVQAHLEDLDLFRSGDIRFKTPGEFEVEAAAKKASDEAAAPHHEKHEKEHAHRKHLWSQQEAADAAAEKARKEAWQKLRAETGEHVSGRTAQRVAEEKAKKLEAEKAKSAAQNPAPAPAGAPSFIPGL